MSGVRKHARNLLANWVGQAAGMVVVFLLSPFVVHTLGKTEYGLWGLLNVFTGYLGVFDLGVRASTGRYIILYLGKGDHQRVGETLRTGLVFFSLVSLLILLVAVGISWAFPYIFPSVPAGYHGMVRVLLPLLALNVWLSAVSGAFSSILAAHDRFDLSNAVDISILVLRTAGTVAVLLAGYGIVGMTLVTVGATALAAVATWGVAKWVYPALRLRPLRMSKDRMRELFSFGIAAFVGNIVGMLVGRTDLVVVGALLGVSAVAIYNVGATAVWYSWPFIGQVMGTIFPSLQRSVGAEAHDDVRWTYVRMMKMVFLVGLPMYLGFAYFGDSFIRLWMGEEFAEAFVVLAVLSAARMVKMYSAAPSNLLYAKGNVWWLTLVGLVFALVNVGASVTLVMWLHWGLVGVAAGSLIAACLSAPVYLRYASQKAGLRAKALLVQVFLPAAAVAAAFAGWCLLVRWWVPGGTWPWFAAQVAVALLGYAAIAAALLVPRSDRARVWKVLGVARAAAGPKP